MMTQIYDSKTDMNITSDPKIMIPMLRKMMPGLIAQQITGVQPMGNSPSVFSYTNNWFFQGHNKTYWPYQHTPAGLIPIRDLERWCWNNISHGRYWRNHGNKFAFKRKEDAAFFILRFS